MELRRNLKRKNLSDCTNIIPTTTTVPPPKPLSDRTNIIPTTVPRKPIYVPRKPFSDRTNVPATVPPKPLSSSVISLTKPPIPSEPAITTRNSDDNSFNYDTSSGSNTAENPRILPQPFTPPRPQTTTTNSDVVHYENSGISTVYTRRQTSEKTRNKGKAVAIMETSSCPPAGRSSSIGDQLDKENIDINFPKSCTVAWPKAKKKRRVLMPLPQDFIDKQKAYFAEIDAFELPEEVVSESELE